MTSLQPFSGRLVAFQIVCLMLFSAIWLPAAQGADAKSRERGHAIAAAHCAECHAIETDDESPTATNANTAFRDLQKRFPIKMLVEAAKTGTIEGHDEMPAFDFSVSEMSDLLAYIDSLSGETSGKYLGPESK